MSVIEIIQWIVRNHFYIKSYYIKFPDNGKICILFRFITYLLNNGIINNQEYDFLVDLYMSWSNRDTLYCDDQDYIIAMTICYEKYQEYLNKKSNLNGVKEN